MIPSRRSADNESGDVARAGAGDARLPAWSIWVIVAVCILPLLLRVMGVDFGADPLRATAPAGNPAGLTDAMHEALGGSFVHALLEWTACCIAMVTVALAFINFRLTGDVTMPILGIAFFCAGCMDAFHTLAAVRLVQGSAGTANLIPFTWVLARMFAAGILTAGVGFVLLRRTESVEAQWHLLAAALLCGVVAYVAILVAASSPGLPQMMFHGSAVPRPYDLVPLALLAFVAVPLILRFHRRHKTLFSHALLISLIPMIAMQMYTAFGSSALFDASFNIAHGLKIVAYAVPLAGLMMDYERSFKERQRVEGELREEEERFELAVRGTSDGMWDWDITTNRVWFASRFKELLGYRGDEFPDSIASLNAHLHPDDYDRTWKAIEDHLQHDDPFDVEYRLRTADGRYRWFRARGVAVRDAHGEPVRMAGTIQDINDRKETIDQLEMLSKRLAQANTEIAVDARIDRLTQMLNRGAWEEAVANEDERSRRHGHPFAVVILDIDHFKEFNDTVGHLAGDECLQRVAACIRETCRIIDVVGRYGGEEFVVLLPETDLDGAAQVAGRMLEALRARSIAHQGLGRGACVTASMGVAQGPDDRGWKHVLKRADEALYRAKEQGRNQVVTDAVDEAA